MWGRTRGEGIQGSLVPRPSRTAFFFRNCGCNAFFHGYEKSCEGRPGYEAKSSVLVWVHNDRYTPTFHNLKYIIYRSTEGTDSECITAVVLQPSVLKLRATPAPPH